jgi:hypothetical protein
MIQTVICQSFSSYKFFQGCKALNVMSSPQELSCGKNLKARQESGYLIHEALFFYLRNDFGPDEDYVTVTVTVTVIPGAPQKTPPAVGPTLQHTWSLFGL